MRIIKIFPYLVLGICLFGFELQTWAQLKPRAVSFDGKIEIAGYQLLEPIPARMERYFIPKALTPSISKSGTPQFLFMKYENDDKSGALIHGLFDFGIPNKDVDKLLIDLKEIIPGVMAINPYPFYEFMHSQKIDSIPFYFVIKHQGSQDFSEILTMSGRLNSSGAIVAGQIPAKESEIIWSGLNDKRETVWILTELSFLAEESEKDIYVEMNPFNIYSKAVGEFGKEVDITSLKDWLKESIQSKEIRIKIGGGDRSDLTKDEIDSMVTARLIKMLDRAPEGKVTFNKTTKKTTIKTKVIAKTNKKENTEIKETQITETSFDDDEIILTDPDFLPRTRLKYYLGSKQIHEVPIQLGLNLSDLYRSERKIFKEN